MVLDEVMDFLRKAWNGEERLWIVFWIYGVGGWMILNLAVSILFSIFHVLFVFSVFCAFVAYVTFVVFWVVSTWRCAFNVDWEFWGYVARVVVVVKILSIISVMLGIYIAKVNIMSVFEEEGSSNGSVIYEEL